ncbi:hypothetical protein MFRU_036g00500 [Monilinia fructicola]|nr:hypothetical protein MFRU_036g00500 [Monilinia fructicola]
MAVQTSLLFLSLWVINVLGLETLPEKTASISYNETSTTSKAATITSGISLECCYLSSFEVGKVLWYSESINITVATISTIVYKYEDTIITSIQTSSTNATAPSSPITRSSINGLPTTIIGGGLGVYEAETRFIHGTTFIDPYGTVYESPTPVWVYTDVIYATASPELKNSAYACPDAGDIKSSSGDEISPYPSGFFLPDDDPEYGWNSPGAISTTLPIQLRSWMVDHAEADRENILTNLAQCKLGAGRGVPTAYIPYIEITEAITTTSTILGSYGSRIISSPVSGLDAASTSKSISATSIHPTIPHPTQSFTTTSITTTAPLVDPENISERSSIQTTSTTVKAVLTNPITSSAAVSASFTSQPSSTVFLSSDEVGGDGTAIGHSLAVGTSTQTTKMLAGGVVTTAVDGAGLGRVVVVMDWGSASTSVPGVHGSVQTGTVPALADSTEVVQSSKDSGTGRGMVRKVDAWCMMGSVALGFLLVWG